LSVIIFLGAGASRAQPLNLPTTAEFARKFEKELCAGKEKNLFELLFSLPDVRDIEDMVRKLQIFEVAFRDLGRIVPRDDILASLQGDFTLNDIPNLCRMLREDIYDALFTEYSLELNDEKIERISQRMYSPLFNVVLESTMLSELAIFTTNYDLAVEYFHTSEYGQNVFSSPIVDGFDRSRYPPVWTGDFANIQDANITLKLFKLHGSLNWRRIKARNHIEHTGSVQRCADPKKEKQEGILIYPANEEGFLLVEPFRALHQYFDIYLRSAKVCIFIGFSFRDQYVNAIIINAIKNSPVKLLAISPQASRNIEQNLPGVSCLKSSTLSKTESGAICIDEMFGGDLVITAIKKELRKLL
jgi:hypothetical protein